MAVSILAIRPDRLATVFSSVSRTSGEGAGVDVGNDEGLDATDGIPGGGPLLGVDGLAGGREVLLGTGRDIGGREISFPVACLNRASTSDCDNTLLPSPIPSSKYHDNFAKP